MDVWGFAERHKKYPDVTLDNLDGYIAAIQNTGKRSAREILPGLGGTNNEPPVMNEVIDYFKDSTLPVFVVCITDGGISKTREIKEAIRRSANYPVFWKFVDWADQIMGFWRGWTPLATVGRQQQLF